jgi:tetratricopeptide (TPR) repeat protein
MGERAVKGLLLGLLVAAGGGAVPPADASLLFAALVLALALLTRRASGRLVVRFVVASGTKGEFRVRVARRALPPSLHAHLDPQVASRVRLGGRIYRVTTGQELPVGPLRPGTWYVAVAGHVEDPALNKTVGEFREEKCVRLGRRESREIRFDFRPSFAWLRLRVTREGVPVPRALVARVGSGEPLGLTRSDGSLHVELPFGDAEFWVGHAGRVVAKQVHVTFQSPDVLEVDLEREIDRLVDGCPGAAERLLRGDRAGAARALEQAGDHRQAQALWGEYCRIRGETEAAAEHFLLADQPDRAAPLLESLGRLGTAAEALVAAGEPRRAAQLYSRAERWEEAGNAYASAFLLKEAADCFERASMLARAVPLLERAGLQLRAGEAANTIGERARAIRAFRSIPAEHPDFAAARRRLEELEQVDVTQRPDTQGVPGGAARRYEILEEIGRGSMGIVFKAYDRVLHRTVALKRLPRAVAGSPRVVSLFLSEARAAARLNHPYIVTIHDVVREDETMFLSMEYLEGQTLRTLLESHGPFPTPGVLRVARHALTGLAYAHSHEVIHRDLKTQNLMWTRHRLLKIADFGVARAVEGASRGGAAGSIHYMSPEQAEGEADARSDLYSLGICLFEIATGRVPFTGHNVLEQHRSRERPHPREFAPELPLGLESVILRMLSIEPGARFQSAKEVLGALESVDLQPHRSEAERAESNRDPDLQPAPGSALR